VITVLAIPTQLPDPNAGYNVPPPRRILWKWSFAVAGILLMVFVWQCGSALLAGAGLADKAVRRFHAQLNSGEYAEISDEADEGLSQGEKRDELVNFLEAAHRRLGNTETEKRINLKVNATTGGTFLIAQYNTQFAQGQAIETFTWRKTGSALKLYAYNVQSTALLK
jgi:hypothetical protein